MSKLEVGDVFEAARGMEVYINIPEKFIYNNMSSNISDTVVKIGETLGTNSEKIKNKLILDIKENFNKRDIDIKDKDIDMFVKEYIPTNEIFDTDDYIGEYVCVSAEIVSGDQSNCNYHSGYYITAEHLKNNKIISFYQSGYYNVVHKNIPILRRMTKHVRVY